MARTFASRREENRYDAHSAGIRDLCLCALVRQYLEFSQCVCALVVCTPHSRDTSSSITIAARAVALVASQRPFARLDEAGVRGAYVDEEEANADGKRKYYRIMKGLDVTAEDKKIENIIKEVFNNLAMKVVIESEPAEDSDLATWIGGLRGLQNLHFEK